MSEKPILQLEMREEGRHRLSLLNVPPHKRDDILSHLQTLAKDINEVACYSRVSFFLFGLSSLPEEPPFQKILGSDLEIIRKDFRPKTEDVETKIAHFRKLTFEQYYRFKENANEQFYLFKKLTADHHSQLKVKFDKGYIIEGKDIGIKDIIDEECLSFRNMVNEKSTIFEEMTSKSYGQLEKIFATFHPSFEKIVTAERILFEKIIYDECYRFKEIADGEYYYFKETANGEYYRLKKLVELSREG